MTELTTKETIDALTAAKRDVESVCYTLQLMLPQSEFSINKTKDRVCWRIDMAIELLIEQENK